MKNLVDKVNHRYAVFALIYLAWCISYVDRSAISYAAPAIAKDFTLSPASVGMIMSSFYLGYALMQIPGGRLADKYGSKAIIIAGLLAWSLFTGLTGAAWSFVSLLTIRTLFGFSEGLFPCASFQTVAEKFEKANRPKATTLLVSSNYLGMFVAPVIIAPMILYFGWRSVFHYIGLFGAAFAIFYWVFIRNSKGENIRVEEENISFRELVRMPLIWQILAIWFCINIINGGLESWMPTYLLTVRGLDLKTVSFVAPIPYLIAMATTAVGGWVIMKFFDGKEKYLLIFGTFFAAIFIYMMYTASTIATLVVFQCCVYFCKSVVFATVIALPAKALPKNLVGSGIGMVNVGGQSAAFVAPMVIGFIVSGTKSFDAAFWFLIAAATCAVFIALLVKPDSLRTSENAEGKVVVNTVEGEQQA
ncbi:MFS transporter [Burkholderia sp. Ac-20349]|nr:MFS transporter [Burkholderia sp. Ac-20349]